MGYTALSIIEYKPTKEHGNADCLSRLPLETDPNFERNHSLHEVINMIQESKLTQLPVTAAEISEVVKKDELLKQVVIKIREGWPDSRASLPEKLRPSF